MKTQVQNTKLGGLGANIGGEQWELAKRKKEIALQYANNLKQINQFQKQRPPIIKQFEKEKSAREKANEFAKNNVPRPRVRESFNEQPQPMPGLLPKKEQSEDHHGAHSQIDYFSDKGMLNDQPMGQYSEDNFGGALDSTGGGEAYTLNQLAQRHEQYADEIEKIKAMLAD